MLKRAARLRIDRLKCAEPVKYIRAHANSLYGTTITSSRRCYTDTQSSWLFWSNAQVPFNNLIDWTYNRHFDVLVVRSFESANTQTHTKPQTPMITLPCSGYCRHGFCFTISFQWQFSTATRLAQFSCSMCWDWSDFENLWVFWWTDLIPITQWVRVFRRQNVSPTDVLPTNFLINRQFADMGRMFCRQPLERLADKYALTLWTFKRLVF